MKDEVRGIPREEIVGEDCDEDCHVCVSCRIDTRNSMIGEIKKLKKETLKLKPPDWWTQEFHGKQINGYIEKISQLEEKLVQKEKEIEEIRKANLFLRKSLEIAKGKWGNQKNKPSVEEIEKAITKFYSTRCTDDGVWYEKELAQAIYKLMGGGDAR